MEQTRDLKPKQATPQTSAWAQWLQMQAGLLQTICPGNAETDNVEEGPEMKRTNTHANALINTYIPTRMHVCMCVYTYICTYIHLYVRHVIRAHNGDILLVKE